MVNASLIATEVRVDRNGWHYWRGVVIDGSGELVWACNLARETRAMAELDALEAKRRGDQGDMQLWLDV